MLAIDVEHYVGHNWLKYSEPDKRGRKHLKRQYAVNNLIMVD